MSQDRPPLLLPRHLYEAMIAQVRGSPGVEVCGLLGGAGFTARRYYPVENIAANPEREFLMEPKAQIDVMRDLRERGEELLGIFHSHPASPAAPSPADLARAAYPDTIYVIAAAGREETVLNAFFYDGDDFTKIDIHITEP
jgi:proteasome lid subunit RPN8/RPN11